MLQWFFGPRMWAADLGVGIVVTTVGFLALHHFKCPISELITKDSTALYGALLTAETALLGFVIAAVSIIAGLISNEPFFDLRTDDEHEYEDFWSSFSWTMRYLGIAAVFSLVAIFVTKIDALQFVVLYLVLFATFTASSSLFRSGINLELVLQATRKAQKSKDAERFSESIPSGPSRPSKSSGGRQSP